MPAVVTDALTELLNIAHPTSLNMSRMPDGTYRATIYATRYDGWRSARGATPMAACRTLLINLKNKEP